jgi:hypothetical protein
MSGVGLDRAGGRLANGAGAERPAPQGQERKR